MNRQLLMEFLGNLPVVEWHLLSEGNSDEFWSSLRVSSAAKPYLDEIRAEGERLLREPIPELTYSLFSMFERSGRRLDFEKVYFERRRRLNTMALLAMLEPEQLKFRVALQDALWSICNEYTWCLPAHLKNSVETDGGLLFSVDTPEWSRRERRTSIDLFAAETGFTLAEIFRLTNTWLPALLRSRIVEEVVQRVFKPYLLHGPFHWEKAEHNWSAVCGGSIASAALLLLDSPEQLAPIVEKALASMEYYLEGFGEDGACLEGVGYWNYGFGYFVYFADLLKRRTRGKLDLFQRDKVRQIAVFQQKAYLDGDILVNFSDSVQRASVQIGLTHYLANLFPEVAVPSLKLGARYTDDHCSRWAPAFRNLLWLNAGMGESDWDTADYYLEDAQWLVSRHESAGVRYGFAAKGGHNGEPHNHNDIGQFILNCGGEVFLCDLGSGEYTDKYFGPERYSYDCNGSQGHSVPIVEGQLQLPGKESAAQELQVSTGQREDRMQFDMKQAYRLPHLTSLVRQFTWDRSETPMLVLRDQFTFSVVPSSIVERIVTKIEPFLEEEAVMLQGEGGHKLLIRFDSDIVQPSIESHTYRDHYGKDTVWYAMDFIVQHSEQKMEHLVELTLQFLE